MKITLAAPITVTAAEGDTPARTIAGLAVPYGVAADAMTGPVRFEAGSLATDGPAPKLIRDHDLGQPIGIVTSRTDTPDGMEFTARISATAAGDEALTLAADGVLDSVSVGVEILQHRFEAGVMIVESGRWRELSLVPFGAFEAAKIAQVAATEPDPTTTPEETDISEEENMTEETTTAAEAPAYPTNIIYAQPRKATLPSLSEYLCAMATDSHRLHTMNEQIRAAAGDVIVSDLDGIVPEPIVQPIYDDLQYLRPIVSAVGARAMPQSGKVFIRPAISTHTQVGVQATELTDLSTRTFVVTDKQVTKKTFGGRAYLSEQSIDWTTPSVLGAVLDDLAGQYALETEAEACAVVDGLPTTTNVWGADFTDAEDIIAKIYGAAATITAGSNYLPSHLICHPNVWAALGSLVATDGRPIFPYLAPSNAGGTLAANSTAANLLGLSLVVSKDLDDSEDNLYVLNARGIEFWEQQKGAISLDNPAQLGRVVAFRGYFAGLRIDETKMIRITGEADPS
jgi:HK97 family phage prohead protease